MTGHCLAKYEMRGEEGSAAQSRAEQSKGEQREGQTELGRGENSAQKEVKPVSQLHKSPLRFSLVYIAV